jgi:signal transduction histidine kinase/ActR/RegA family two-component response regulator
MVLPLVARGQMLGAMTFVSTDPARRYSDADLAVARELADRAGTAIDNARLYRELQESNQLKDEFLGTVSHELRTPLNAVLGWTQILRRAMAGPDQSARALDAIERNARAQAQLVDDLLDTSRVVSGKLRVEFAPTDVSDIIQTAAESFGPLARGRGVTITVRTAPDLVPVTGDAARLQQVIGNLLSNALKFTPAGGRVEIAAARVGATTEIVVSDTGGGIAPEFLPFVFDRFRQGDSTTTRAHGGLGLGLSIARHLVELHGGTIRAQSAGEAQGATFTVVLPIRAAGDPAASPLAGAGEAARQALADVRVLVVDDQEEARTLLRAMLATAGARVYEASSAGEARSIIEQQRPDVLVSDIGMPREDGYELIRSIRQADHAHELARLPAIAVSAYARDDDRDRALAAGYDRHITKPVDPEALLEAVAAVAPHGSSA